MKRIMNFAAIAVSLALCAAPAFGDDRSLLYTRRAEPANVMILVANTESMSTCIPGATLPNNQTFSGTANTQTCTSLSSGLGANLAPAGVGDSPYSKMGVTKAAINYIMQQHPTSYLFGLTSQSYSRQTVKANTTKRYTFQAVDDTFTSSDWPYHPAGTILDFGSSVCYSGQHGSCSSVTTLTASSKTYQVVPIGGLSSNGSCSGESSHSYSSSLSNPCLGMESFVQSFGGDSSHQPYLLGTDSATRSLVTNPTDSGSNKKQEVLVTYNTITCPSNSPYTTSCPTSPFRIRKCKNNCTTSTIGQSGGFDGDYFTVTKNLVECGGSGSPCDPTTATAKKSTTVRYVVPTAYCSETDSGCTYPTVYGYSGSGATTGGQIGEEMGWLYYDELDVSGNQAGWIVQSNNNPQPMVMIPHYYTPWKSYNNLVLAENGSKQQLTLNYTQHSNPCIFRAFRPLSSIEDNTLAVETDHYPLFTPTATQTDDSTNTSSTNCDVTIDGLLQNAYYPNGGTNEIAPIVFPAGHNGAGLQLVKMLSNVYQYFNGGNSACTTAGGGVDGFCGGIRLDDTFSNCRQSAVLLVTDSFTGSSPDFKFGNSTDPTSLLKAINVPVFVIGFAMAPNSQGTNACTLKSGVSGNTGQCIADNTGATTYNGTSVTRQGYYLVSDASGLSDALGGVLNSLSTANRDFATATVPSVSATSAGIAYLSQFNPRNNRSVWEGHLRAYFLDPITGLVKSQGSTPDPTAFSYWTGSTAATGSLLWDGGNSGNDTPNVYGNLDGARLLNPTLLLTSSPGPGGTWTDSTHDQASGVVGRNVFFGIRPGDAGCTGFTYGAECLAQVPVGTGGTSPVPGSTTEPSTGWVVPSAPSSLPAWWTNVRDSSSYVNVPTSPLEGTANRSQALQNSFSFLRGNRDPVVETLHVSSKFVSNPKCSAMTADADSPCYYGETLGDLFHSNPVIVAAPNNSRYLYAQDSASTLSQGTYSDRGNSYQTFATNYGHRRKILYVGSNDGLFHAFDIGVYNGDQSTYTPSGGSSTCPLCNRYDFGSGREIFAYAPRAGLNKAYSIAHTDAQDWTIDGPPSVDDVYIDVTRVGGSVQGVAPSGSSNDADISGANPASASHSWRTVVVGTEREGGLSSSGSGIASGTSGLGGSVFALDITDPDQTSHMTTTDTGGHRGVPECIVSDFTPGTTSNPSNCSAPFPRILWELRDDQSSTATAPFPVELSTSTAATTQDLGMTWSQPVLGRVKIKVGTATRDFFVAIFGGGYDHTGLSITAANTSGNTGNFLYMVDIETGKIIYKKNLGPWNSGASSTSTAGNLATGVPGAPAVIDLNFDGYLDYVYIGDTQGRLWKVDLTQTATLGSSTSRVQDGDWTPTLYFDEYLNSTAQGSSPRQPIFSRPTTFYAGNTSSGQPKVGIGFGTGDRDNMPDLSDTNTNFFVVLVDPPSRTSPAVSTDQPLTLADLTLTSLTSSSCTTSNCMNANGYYVKLDTGSGYGYGQIVNTDPLIYNQAIYFNTFRKTTVAGNCNEVGVPYVYILDYATGYSKQKDANGNTVAYTTGPTGSEVLSTPILYTGPSVANQLATNSDTTGQTLYNVTASADTTGQDQLAGGTLPPAKVKSWKEQ